MIVADALHRAALLYGDAPALICGAARLTYAELEERSNRLAHALAAGGLAPGDRVAVWLENGNECIEIDCALAKAGLVRVSLNPRLTRAEAEYILADSQARLFIFGASFDATLEPALLERLQASGCGALRVREGGALRSGVADYGAMLAGGSAAAPGVRFDAEHLYCLFYTSGTTGKPKGVMLSHRAMLHVAWNLLMEVGPLQVGEKALLMQPLSHGAGFFVLPQLIKGGVCVIMRHFDPAEVLHLAAEHQVEMIKLIPTMLQRILRVPGVGEVRLPRLRAIIYGASPMPEEPLRQAIQVFGAGKLVQIYGQSECPVTLTVLHGNEHRLDTPWPQRLTSAGRPWATVEVRIVDEAGCEVAPGGVGEVVLRGPHLMSGYWKRPDTTAETVRDGWLHTKDMGRVDEHGFVYLLGRRDEMIISGGYNIAPREIEDVLYQHAAVHEAAVLGEPDPEWGQAVVAYVCVKDGSAAAAEATARELLEFTRPRLGFKRPKRIYLMRELPKNPAGKIQKKALQPATALACVGSGA